MMNDFQRNETPVAEEPAAVLPGLVKKKSITSGDVAALRNAECATGLVSRAQAERMFAIERGAARKCRAWGDLLVETMLDYVVWGERPTGVLTDEAAGWLLRQVGPEPTPACLALLVAVLEEATTLPAGFHDAVRRRAMRTFGGDTELNAAA